MDGLVEAMDGGEEAVIMCKCANGRPAEAVRMGENKYRKVGRDRWCLMAICIMYGIALVVLLTEFVKVDSGVDLKWTDAVLCLCSWLSRKNLPGVGLRVNELS